MSYRFRRKDKSVKAGLRRIALERIDRSLAVLLHMPGGPVPEELHMLRKNVKKLRGLLRLVRPVFPDFETENEALRQAGQLISGLRDGHVLQSLLMRHAQDLGLDEDTARRLDRAVKTTAQHAYPDPQTALDEHRLILTALKMRAAKWKPDAQDFAALRPGLEKTLTQARRAFACWADTQDMEDLHRLRKRLKEHWYHARLLEPIWPRMMAPHAQVADDLCTVLGRARDNALLAEALAGIAGGGPVIARAEAEAAQHRAEAVALGACLLAEPPRALAKRWQGWWRLWRA